MKFEKSEIEGVYSLRPRIFSDARGSFHESFRSDKTLDEIGFDFEVAQVNNSVSRKGVIRGIHFKKYPPGQAKIVSVSQGAVIDVAIDLRKSSHTFGRYQAFELSAENCKSILIGYGIGHAFLSLEENTVVQYLCDSVFEPEIEFGINPLKASIDWEKIADAFSVKEFIISPKDKQAVSLAEAGELLFD